MNIQKIISNLKIERLNKMQEEVLEKSQQHNDLILLSPTGSGKTLAFLLPLVQTLTKENSGVQALILVPSRELALQIEQVFKSMGSHFKVSVCYGGHDKKTEVNNLAEAPAVLIGTPGRVAYHIRHGNFDAKTISFLVLDEFDKALEFGFQDDMGYIISEMTGLKQRILTSATAMTDIPEFTQLENPKTISFLKAAETKPQLQFRKVMTTSEEKLDTLFNLLCKIGNRRCLIFCNHRDAVDRISALLAEKGIERETFHGGMEQDERESALLKFRNDSSRILITTDLAARGLDIAEVESIVHYQLPPKEDAFIHRNGRTARMNAKGFVYLIMTPDESFPFIKNTTQEDSLSGTYKIPEKTPFVTLYISAGKKDKVNKVDIVGFLIKKGLLAKEDIGLIEVKDHTSYVAVHRQKIAKLVQILKDQRLKNQKLKIEVAR